MPHIPTEKFIDACMQVVRANEEFVPPYGTGATLYLRPFVIGVGDNIGVHAAPEYIFSVFCSPVGPYFKGGMAPTNFIVSDFDRAAPNGTGAAKVGGNYAASLLPGQNAKIVILGIVSTWTQLLIQKLKKLARLISLVLQRR